ncbi:hypothetical protein [Corallococcus sp. AS-1-6]|uniref:hypothetical protein n=1 Tax=Corallococcus sp. AS-1-6 TaxID=2874599 RepID=UPI001CBB00BD|nr:hypothetical protein [Corallococcus sp. AS-1-6]MBZ4373208.1 hypothetical protein [Corallococcus sp. AS-1-6]
MKSADVSGMPKELEEVRRIALGEVPADEAQVRAALAQAWAWLAPLTSASLSDEPSPCAAAYATEDVERWFRAVVARTQGALETLMARMLRDAALEGAKVPGLAAELETQANRVEAISDTLDCDMAKAPTEVVKLKAERDALRAQVVELEQAVLARAEAQKRTSLVLRDAPSALSAETTLSPNSSAIPDGSTPPAYRMLSQVDVRPTVPPLMPLSERIQYSLAKVGHEPTPLTTAAADALHPLGRCTCVGEGTCTWCRARCGACGSPYIPEAVRHALRQVWGALHVTTAHQGVAVAVLRAVYPELPVPIARAGADSLLAWDAFAQVVTEAARLGAEDMRERAAWTSSNVPMREVEERIRRLSLLPWEEVSRG